MPDNPVKTGEVLVARRLWMAAFYQILLYWLHERQLDLLRSLRTSHGFVKDPLLVHDLTSSVITP